MGINNVNVAYAMERDVVSLFYSMVIGAAGAVSSIQGGGVKSITKLVDDGAYEIEFTYDACRLLGSRASIICDDAAGSGIATIEVNENPLTIQADFLADRKVKIQMRDITGAKANAVAGSVVTFRTDLRRSSEGPWD